MLLDHILSKLRSKTLDLLQSMTQKKKANTWLTTYLVSFILLHNVALITKHDKEYAEKHRMEDRTKVNLQVGNHPIHTKLVFLDG